MDESAQHIINRGRGQKRLLLAALILTVAMMIVEFVAGWLTGSLSLTADAVHMLTDASALALSLFAAWFSSRPATPQKTYGYYRTEILAAFVNGLALCGIVVVIYVRAITRFQHPTEIISGPMILVATVGLMVNLAIGWLLTARRIGNLNIQSAWLNVMSDALGSAGVIVAGILIHLRGWLAADAVASFVIGLLIAINAWKLIGQAVNILLEGAPVRLNTAEVIESMRTIPGVREVHDLHLWTITTGIDAMSGHIRVQDVAESTNVLSALKNLLSEQFGITHTTFQLEPYQSTCKDAHCS